MRYSDGNEARIGDVIAIDEHHHGNVVANLDANQFSDAFPRESWQHLQRGILVETDFAGLVHYPNGEHEVMRLLERGK
jgi:hypothetical protein